MNMSKLGVTINVRKDLDLFAKMREIKQYGFGCCQLVIWDVSLETKTKLEMFLKGK